MHDATPAGPGRRQGSREVLFVCLANVCRSPMMAFLTQRALLEHDLDPQWQLRSAGVGATDGQVMCPDAAEAIAGEPAGEEFARRHRSRAVSAPDVEGAGLVLVASRHERSAVARLSAGARHRTFTMVEAALLSQRAADRGGSLGRFPSELGLEGVVALMHAQRGTLKQGHPDLVGGRLRAPVRRRAWLDVPDVHTGEVRSHRPVFESLRRASGTLVTSLVRMRDAAP